jgi:hypothetical protein
MTSKLDIAPVYSAIRAWRKEYVSRKDIVANLKSQFDISISISGLDQWLRNRSQGKRSKLRHQLPPLETGEATSISSPANIASSQQKSNQRADLARRLGI